MEKNTRTQIKQLLSIISIFLGLILFNELLFRLSIQEIFTWIVKNPFLFTLNIAFLMFLMWLVTALTKKVYFSIWLILITGLILGIANANKFSLRSVPLVFEDLFLLKEVWVLLPKLLNPKTLIAIILGIPLLLLSLKIIRKGFGHIQWQDIKKPLNIMCLCSILCLSVGQFAYTNDLDAWQVGFLYSLSNGTRQAPPIEEAIAEKAKDLLASERLLTSNKLPSKPNVLVIMSESFWDVRHLNLKFSDNPMDKWDLLLKESLFGNLYVPVFGGGTANTEYEVLTGMTLKTYPYDWHMVYREDITSPQPSIVNEYAKSGYKTIAMHPYYPWYYKRNEVYPLLGFQEFLSLDYFTTSIAETPEDTESLFVSDQQVTDKLLELIESETVPIFVHTVTMQNHGPYDDNRFNTGIDLYSSLSEEASQYLTTYTRGIHQSQEALYQLIAALRNTKEPTLVVFFGDHLPMLGDDYAYYRETGYIKADDSPENLKEDLRMMTIPYIMWANYPIQTGETPLKNASYLSVDILEKSGLSLSPYFSTVKDLSKKAPILLRRYLIDEKGEVHSRYTQYYQEIRALYSELLANIN